MQNLQVELGAVLALNSDRHLARRPPPSPRSSPGRRTRSGVSDTPGSSPQPRRPGNRDTRLTCARRRIRRVLTATDTYDAQTRGPVPIPPSERGLQTVVAEPWFKVSDEGLVLEGPAFDRDGNLLFCDVSGRRVLRLTPDRRLSTIVSLDELGPGGLAVHKDGRVFIAAMDLAKGIGAVLAVEPDGSGMQAIVPPEAGYMPNDLVFDARGGFYFTDFRGASTDPKGGVYYVSPDFGTITPVLPRLAMANGIALSPGGKELWATEFSGNLLQDRDRSAPRPPERYRGGADRSATRYDGRVGLSGRLRPMDAADAATWGRHYRGGRLPSHASAQVFQCYATMKLAITRSD